MKMIILFLLFFTSAALSQINDLNNHFMLGENYEQAGELEKAKSIYEELYKNNPSNYLYFDALNRVYLQLKEYESSIQLIEEKLKTSTQDINLYGMLGKTFYLKSDENKAYQIWEEALVKIPPSQNNYRVIANYAIERRAFEKAIEFLTKGKSVAEDPSIFSYDLANIYSLTMQFEEAAEEYCSILASNPNQLRNIESRILSYINKPGAIEKTISVIEDCSGGDQINYDYLLARLYIDKKSYDKAFDLYLKVDEKLNNQGAELFNFAHQLLNEGEYNTAEKAFNEIMERYPNSPFISSAKLGYVKTIEESLKKEVANERPDWKPYYKNEPYNSGKVDEVISAYNELSNLYNGSEIGEESLYRIGLIKLYIQNEPAEAEDYFNRVVNNSPLSKFAADAYQELGNISLENGELDEASNYFMKIVDNNRSSEEKKNYAKFMLAKINLYRGSFDRAKEILGEILNNLKDNIANDAIELSLLLNTKMNDSTNLVRFAEAEFFARQKKFKEAAELYNLISQDQKAFMLKHLAKLREAQMELALNNVEKSVEVLGIIANEIELNIYADKALYLLAKIYRFGLKDIPKAIEVYEKLLAKFPNSLYLDEAREGIIQLRNKLS